MQVDRRIRGFSIHGLPRPEEKKLKNKKNKRSISFKTRAKPERAATRWNPAAQTRPVLDSSSFFPVPKLPRRLATILLLAFSLFELDWFYTSAQNAAFETLAAKPFFYYLHSSVQQHADWASQPRRFFYTCVWTARFCSLLGLKNEHSSERMCCGASVVGGCRKQ